MLQNCLKSFLPPRNSLSPQYYALFGRVHIEIALIFIIIASFVWDVIRWVDFFLSGHSTPGRLEILMEICDAIFKISLAIAYCYKSALLLLPYLFIQLFKLNVAVVTFCLCILAIIWPESSWTQTFYSYLPTKEIRLNALIHSVSSFLFALIMIWVIRVLLACYVYFSNQRNASIGISTANNLASEISTNATTLPNDPQDVPRKASVASTPSTPSYFTFTNPNFKIDDEDGEDQLWPQEPSKYTS